MEEQLSEFEINFLKGLEGVISELDSFCQRTGEVKCTVLFYLLKLELLNQKDMDTFNNIDWLLESKSETYAQNKMGEESVIFRSRNTFPSEFCGFESSQEGSASMVMTKDDVKVVNRTENHENEESGIEQSVTIKAEPEVLPEATMVLEQLEDTEDEALQEAVLQVQNAASNGQIQFDSILLQEAASSAQTNDSKTKVLTENENETVSDAALVASTANETETIQLAVNENGETIDVNMEGVLTAQTVTDLVQPQRQIILADRRYLNNEKCPVCTKSFDLPHQLKRHLLCHTNERKHKCTQCEKSFKDYNNLTYHIKIKHGEKGFQCRSCPKSFTSAEELKSHASIKHKKVMKYRCKLCQRPFSTLTNFNKHKDVHRMKNPANCDICGWAFAGSGMLFLHQKKHHREVWEQKTKERAVKSKANKNEDDSNLDEMEDNTSDFDEENEDMDTTETENTEEVPDVKAPLTRPKRTRTKPKKYDDADTSKVVKSEPGLETISVEDLIPTDNLLETQDQISSTKTEHDNSQSDDEELKNNVNTDSKTSLLNTTQELYNENYKEPYKEFRNHIFKCLYCNEEFKKRRDYVIHVVEDHDQKDEIPFPCNMCTETFYVLSEFRRHLRWHNPELKCELCEEMFYQKWDLNRHLKTVHGMNPSVLCTETRVCDKCGKSFQSKSALNKHVKLHDRPNLYKCDICDDREFKGKAEYKFHMKSHEASQPAASYEKIKKESPKPKDTSHRQYHCAYCDEAFLHKSALLTHMNKVHEHTEEILYPCSVCNKPFSTIARVKRHEKTHGLGGPETFHVCEVCGKSFNDKGNYNKHIQIHTGEKNYRCLQCPKAYSTKSALIIHNRKHTGDRPHKCSFCTKTFTCPGALAGHTRIHTGETPYVCSICGWKFKDRSHMNRHVKSHTKLDHIRPFRCHVTRCGKSFTSQDALDKHMDNMHVKRAPIQIHPIGKPRILKQDIDIGSLDNPQIITVATQIQ